MAPKGSDSALSFSCREVENDVAALKALLADSQAVKTENEQLKLQLDSLQALNLLVQKKVGEGRSVNARRSRHDIESHVIQIGELDRVHAGFSSSGPTWPS